MWCPWQTDPSATERFLKSLKILKVSKCPVPAITWVHRQQNINKVQISWSEGNDHLPSRELWQWSQHKSPTSMGQLYHQKFLFQKWHPCELPVSGSVKSFTFSLKEWVESVKKPRNETSFRKKRMQSTRIFLAASLAVPANFKPGQEWEQVKTSMKTFNGLQ